jgi:type 1 glutamine amidotransferase
MLRSNKLDRIPSVYHDFKGPMLKQILAFALSLATILSAPAADKKILLVAGKPSHGPGEHEFNAGCMLLAKCLNETPGIKATVAKGGWPADESAFDGMDAVFFYMDGGPGHPVAKPEHIKKVRELAAKGVGIGFGHYAVEVVAGEPGDAWKEWIGGHYEDHYSVNPMWSPEYKTFPKHPVANGVKPFSNRDEWYFNMRWRSNTNGIIPILVDKPSDDVRDGPYVYPAGPYKHITDASGRAEAMMWVVENPDHQRGFGFTGGHTHKNWGDENQRKVVLNALVWIAHGQVPKHGIQSTITPEDLQANLDDKRRR